mmetsp:Transcript_54247/g.118289  ORF Transcript_54247/g.118289 Transcript_54247/m.118289 type:complete len:214 (-) Transcript_54247:2097-2738(-)
MLDAQLCAGPRHLPRRRHGRVGQLLQHAGLHDQGDQGRHQGVQQAALHHLRRHRCRRHCLHSRLWVCRLLPARRSFRLQRQALAHPRSARLDAHLLPPALRRGTPACAHRWQGSHHRQAADAAARVPRVQGLRLGLAPQADQAPLCPLRPRLLRLVLAALLCARLRLHAAHRRLRPALLQVHLHRHALDDARAVRGLVRHRRGVTPHARRLGV